MQGAPACLILSTLLPGISALLLNANENYDLKGYCYCECLLDWSLDTRRFQSAFNSAITQRESYGARTAMAIMKRMAVRTASNLALVHVTASEQQHKLV